MTSMYSPREQAADRRNHSPEAEAYRREHGQPGESLPEGSEFPPRGEVNWEILKELADRPHPLYRVVDTDNIYLTETMYCVLVSHHLLDLAGVPHGYSVDTRTIDCRVLLAIMAMGNLRERLARIAGWHERETGPAGTVGDFCTECGHRWPCDTRRMADGIYTDPEA